MFGLFKKKTEDHIWVEGAKANFGSITTVSDVLLRGANAVAQDPIIGWSLESEIMGNLQSHEDALRKIKEAFKQLGTPKISSELKQVKDCIDQFVDFGEIAFYWGKTHYNDASGKPGDRARYDHGMVQKAAIKRVTNNAIKFRDNAFKSSRFSSMVIEYLSKLENR